MDDEENQASSSSSSSSKGAPKEEVYYRSEKFDEAVEVMDVKPEQAVKAFHEIIAEVEPSVVAAAKSSRMKEEAIYNLGRIYAKASNVDKVKELMVEIRPFFGTISKPRSAKIGTSLWCHVSCI